jgi:hypothetical protein
VNTNTPATPATPATPLSPNAKRNLNRGAAKVVIDVLTESRSAITSNTLVQRTGLDQRTVDGAMSYLVKRGMVHRLGKGIYRPSETLIPADPPEPIEPEPHPAQAVAQAASDRDTDDLIEALLDLLFPDGLKAAQWKTIDTWVEATRQMLNGVHT